MAALPAATVSGAFCAMARARPCTSSASRSAGTTRLTRPIRSASAAVNRRAENSTSDVQAGPIRVISVLTPAKPKPSPSRAAGMPNWLPSAAILMSACNATLSPPPRQKPRIMAMTGFSRLAQVVLGPGFRRRTLLAELGDVGTRRERPVPGAGDDHDPDVPVLVEPAQQTGQGRAHLAGKGVHLQRVVEGQGGDAVRQLGEQLAGTGG